MVETPAFQPPIIIVGMHRSGTTLLVRLLEKLGVWIGRDATRGTAESVCFRRINYQILAATGGTWRHPAATVTALAEDATTERFANWCRTRCLGWRITPYLGRGRYLAGARLDRMTGPWCWKDPRTTVTLAVWHGVFPTARFVHVVRNGIDVARSLCVRDRKLRESASWRVRDWLRRQLPNGGEKVSGSDFQNLGEAFQLWEDYLAAADRFLPLIPAPQRYEFHYEDLLTDPIAQLQALTAFLQLDLSPAQMSAAAATIKTERGFAYRQAGGITAEVQALLQADSFRQAGYDGTTGLRLPVPRRRSA